MTDDPRRRHLTPEEAAELRRRAREARGYADPGAPRDRRAPRTRRPGPLRILGLILVVVLTLGVAGVIWADSTLQRIDALTDYPGRGGKTPGTVTLLVGTDSREGLTPEQQAQLSTGSESDAGGRRTDTMMLVYTPRDGGRTMLISLPRDLLVDIPGYGQNKLNAAYAFGGPALLTQTLEEQSGVRIDHYAEIGFGGFAGIVDAVGGVDLCLDEPINDPLAGLDLAAGCQTLTGPQALGFVRTRYGFAEQDLQRVRNQRQFLGALMRKTMSPGILLNPFTALPLVDSAAASATVDTGDHIWNLASVMWKLRGDPLTVTAPYDGMESGDVGSYLVWGPSTTEFFDAVASGRTPPAGLPRVRALSGARPAHPAGVIETIPHVPSGFSATRTRCRMITGSPSGGVSVRVTSRSVGDSSRASTQWVVPGGTRSTPSVRSCSSVIRLVGETASNAFAADRST